MNHPDANASVGLPAPLRRAWVSYALAGLVTAAIVGVNMDAETLDDHEAKAALTAKGMLGQAGWVVVGPAGEPLKSPPPDTPINRWLIPVNNGRPRLVKTPLQYWLIAVAGAVLGGVTPVTARVPAALSAVACVLITLALGRRMFGPRAALFGALMLATSVGLQKWGRSARPEMVLTLLITAAMACVYMGLGARTGRGRAGWMAGFWVAMALANLAKQFLPLLLFLPLLAYVFWRHHDARARTGDVPGEVPRRALGVWAIATAAAVLVAVAAVTFPALHVWRLAGLGDTRGGLATMGLLVGAPLAWYMARTRGWRGVWPLLPMGVVGAAVMFAAFLPWMAHLRHLFAGAAEVFSEQIAERAAGSGEWHMAAPWYYLLPLVELTLPWIVFLPGALAAAWMKRFGRHRRALVYLFCWSAGLIAMLTLSAGKREHYILPMLPAICLLMGFIAEEVFFVNRWIPRRGARRIGIGYAVVGLAAPLLMAGLWVAACHADAWLPRLADPPRWARHLESPEPWRYLVLVTALGALPLAVAMRRMARWQLAGVVPAIAVSMLVFYIGFHARGHYWDGRKQVAEFALRAADAVGPDAAVGSWGDPLAKTVFYFGRDIPNVHWRRDRWMRQLTPRTGLARWRKWMTDARNVEYMFCYDGAERQVQQLEALGFEPVLSVSAREECHLVFVLMRRGAPAGTSSVSAGKAAAARHD